MASLRSVRYLIALAAVTLGVLSIACHVDMLLKPKGTPQAVLTVSPNEIRDSARAGSDEIRSTAVEITNSGGGTATWSASEHAVWLRLEPRQGEVPPADTLSIVMDPEDLGPGVYESDVTVVLRGAADTQSTTIAVTFVVQRPGLNVSPTSIEKSTRVNSNATFTETLSISNSGDGELTWTARKDEDWLTLGATSGTGNASVSVTINSAGLRGGTYHDEIVITAPGALGSPARVSVTLTVLAPGLAVSPLIVQGSAAAGSTTPVNRTLHITNSGNGSITWTASKSQPWVSLSRTSGGAPEDVTVTMNPTGLPPGPQRDTIVFVSPEATNGPVKVPVEFEITQPGLAVSPTSINATADDHDSKKQQFELSISNTSGGTLAWFATADRPWISASPPAGLAPSTLTVTIDPGGLSTGPHDGTVTVSSPGAAGSPFVVPVHLEITTRPCGDIGINPDVIRPGTLDANDCVAPHRPGSFANIYTFNADAGETYSMRLTASFDAYLFFIEPAGNVLAQNDECPGESGTACIREITVPSNGRYVIEATSTAAGASGPLTMTVIRERPPGPPGGLGQSRADGATNLPVGATTPETEVVIRGRVDDPNVNAMVRFEVELAPTTSGFAGVATHATDFLTPGTTTSVRAAGLANNTGYHWQARACDQTGRCSMWIPFGNNPESAADFVVAVPPPPGGSPRPE